MSQEPIQVTPIATLCSEFKQKFGTPRQGFLATQVRARVELAPIWRGRGVFAGLEGYSHVWLISYLHQSTNSRLRGKVHPPRLMGKKVGVMASRSPHRPNPIGLTLARVVKCEGDELFVTEVDLVDGTPILDVKPYVAAADRPEQYTLGWVANVPHQTRPWTFSSEALQQLAQLERAGEIDSAQRVRKLIGEMLTQDPRPPAYLEREEARFEVYLGQLNVTFKFKAEQFFVESVAQTTAAPR